MQIVKKYRLSGTMVDSINLNLIKNCIRYLCSICYKYRAWSL